MVLCREPEGLEYTPMLRISLESNLEAPAMARAAIAGFLTGSEIDPERLDMLTLLVSELVSNAVIHSNAPAASEILLCAHILDQGAVRIEVTDRGSGFTAVPRDPSRADGGYGLYLVDRYATRWGVDQQGGNCVCFEIPSRASQPTDAMAHAGSGAVQGAPVASGSRTHRR
jgi:anti-sigma regulatory factor (Ser/Thr protein kinase)